MMKPLKSKKKPTNKNAYTPQTRAHERVYALTQTPDARSRINKTTAHHHVGDDNCAEYGSYGAEDGDCGGVVQYHDQSKQEEPARQQHTAILDMASGVLADNQGALPIEHPNCIAAS